MSKPLLLIVDDEPDIRTTFTLLFELEGFDVVTATDGMDALRKMALRRPDVVVSDFMMPRMDGIELCTQMREDTRTRDIPFIMTSSMRPPGGEGLRPFDHFVPKPADFVDVLMVVQRLLNGPR